MRSFHSFPGGMADPEDRDVTATALRELEEELSCRPVRILGLCDDVYDRSGTIAVTPLIAYMGHLDVPHLQPCQHEVKHVFALPLTSLLDAAQRGYVIVPWRGRVPVYNRDQEHFIWGLTAFILEGVLDKVLAPTSTTAP
jgi:8-oxo-dGTP pyrophosphatase MutT (NUDIX family)